MDVVDARDLDNGVSEGGGEVTRVPSSMVVLAWQVLHAHDVGEAIDAGEALAELVIEASERPS